MYKSVKNKIIHVSVKFHELINRNASHHENKNFKQIYGNCGNLTAVCMFFLHCKFSLCVLQYNQNLEQTNSAKKNFHKNP
jgi:hypothetical protein